MTATGIRKLMTRKCICLLAIVFVGCSQEQQPANLSRIPSADSGAIAYVDSPPAGDRQEGYSSPETNAVIIEQEKVAVQNATEAQIAERIKLYTAAAIQGDASAQLYLGAIYYSGQGVPQNYKEAAKWYRKAAEQGAANAQSQLCGMYHSGEGVPQDNKEAAKWLGKAAKQGVALAQCLLGDLYQSGQGVPQDYKEAVKW